MADPLFLSLFSFFLSASFSPPPSPVPPSIPTCRIQGALDVGNDIMLMCGSDEGIPTPTYSWEKLEAVPRLPHTAMQGIKLQAVGVPFCPTFTGK